MAPMPPMQMIQKSFESINFWFPSLVYGIMGALWIYNRAYNEMDRRSDQFRATYFDKMDTFDFIVVGGGSAGAVVANRLSKQFEVLLLEAGGEPNPSFSVPVMSFMNLNYPAHDWMYSTVPQKYSSGALVDRISGWSAGKSLGGTSNLNFLIYLRGHKQDYDYIANLTGDQDWSYEGVLPQFKSIENYEPKLNPNKGEWDNDKYHGHNGDIPLQIPPYVGMANYFVKAGAEMGYKITDLNAEYEEGFSLIYYPMKNGRRYGTYKAFIEPVRTRANLKIYKFSEVTKILFNQKNEAVGVDYLRHGVKKSAYAKKEVIISAGSIGSPKLLMLSGIGPQKDLKSLGIKVRANLPVGKNLQDHISSYLGPFIINDTKSMMFDRDINGKAMVEFVQDGKGVLTSSGCSATAFFSTSYAKNEGESSWPDIQLIFLGNAIYRSMATEMSHGFHVKPDIMKKYFDKDLGKDSFQIIVSLARPRARGYISLGGASHKSDLIIDPKYLDNDHDMNVLLEGVKTAVNLVENSTTFAKIGAKFTDSIFPGCEHVEFRSDAYWRCFIRQYSITLHHIVGPCSMGKKGSPDAVVDTRLRVLGGVKRLRVIDASVLPKVPVSNTNAASIMVGEKGAQYILSAWNNSTRRENEDF